MAKLTLLQCCFTAWKIHKQNWRLWSKS